MGSFDRSDDILRMLRFDRSFGRLHTVQADDFDIGRMTGHKRFDVPTLVIHDDDQILPLDISGKASAAQIKGAKLIAYPCALHGPTDTHKERFNQDLLDFLKM